MRLLLIGIIPLLMLSCASKEKETTNPFDPLTLERVLKIGETDQAGVVRELGSPNIVARSSSGEESWTYSRMSYNRNGTNAGIGLSTLGYLGGGFLIPGANVGMEESSQSSASMDLVLTFDESHVLSSYNILQTQY